MPRSTQLRRKGHGEVIPPLNVLERVDSLLKEHLSIFPSKAELTEEEIEHWHRDLAPYRLEAIEFAFNEWRRNGHFFPVFADVIDLCKAWEPSTKNEHKCSAECRSRHGRGYGWGDVLWLWKQIVGNDAPARYFSNGNPRLNKALAQSRALSRTGKDADLTSIFSIRKQQTINWDELLDELDRSREGGPPAWRK